MVNAFRLGGIVTLAVTAALPAGAAKRLGPPSEALTAPENRTALVRAVQIGEGDALFDRLTELHGETPERIRVRLGEESLARIAPGESYLLGYTVLRRDRRRAPVYELDPEGPRIVEVPAVGEALFEDSAALRRLVEVVEAGDPEPRAVLDAVVAQLESPDPASRRLVLAELALRPELAEAIEASDLAVFRRLLESGELAPVAADYLLRALRPSIGSGELEWLRPVCLDIVGSHDRHLDLGSLVPALLETALEVLAEVGKAGDAERLVEHLYSNNPGVGREALGAIEALDAELAVRSAAEALETGGVHGDVAREISRLLSRRDRQSGDARH